MVMTDVGTGGVQSCENYTTVGSVSLESARALAGRSAFFFNGVYLLIFVLGSFFGWIMQSTHNPFETQSCCHQH